jgi:tetratricopeptide (TPR) repeat protein
LSSKKQIPALTIPKKYRPWIITFLALGLYLNTLTHDFALDDAIVIYDNMFTTEGISGWGGILSHDTFYGFFKEEGKDKLVSGGRYRPLSMLVFAMIYEFAGDNPFLFHLINVLFYGLCCLILYLVLSDFLPKIIDRDTSEWVAFGSALMFTAHPIHTEVVANIKGADEIMALGLVLLSWWFVLRRTKLAGLWAGIIFFLALLAKENAVTFLGILPAAEWIRRDFRWGRAKKWWPLFTAFAIYMVIRFSILGAGIASEPPKELMNNPFLKLEQSNYVPLDPAERTATIVYTLGKYAKLLIVPYPLTHDYYPRHIPIKEWNDPFVIGSFLLYLMLGSLMILGLKARKLWGLAITWYLFSLSIFSNILFPVGTLMSERFLFMPSLGFCLLIGWLFGYRDYKPNFRLLLLVILISASAILTILRNPVWKDNYTLFTTDVKTSARSAKVRNAAAGAILEGVAAIEEENERNRIAKEAEEHLKVALEIHPNYKNALLLMGNAKFYQRDYPEAVKAYNNALRIDPFYEDAMKNLHLAYREGGRFFGEIQGNLDKSIQWLEKATELSSADLESWRLLGVAYGINGQTTKAIEAFGKTVEIRPNRADLWVNLGKAYTNAGLLEKGKECFEKAKKLDPNALN